MRRAQLHESVSLIAELPRTVDERTGRITRSTPVCSSCQFRRHSLPCHYSVDQRVQEWQLTSTLDSQHCNSCDSSCSIVWLTLN